MQLFSLLFPLQHMNLKDQLYSISGSEFCEWLIEPKTFSGLSRSAHQVNNTGVGQSSSTLVMM